MTDKAAQWRYPSRMVLSLRAAIHAWTRSVAVAACISIIPLSLVHAGEGVPAPQRVSIAEALASLPGDKHAELVRQGHRIVTDTPVHARRYTGNGLSCANCHLDAGRKPYAAPLSAAWPMYPAFLIKSNKVATFEERVQECFRFSMNGFAPTVDSHEMRAISAYAQWLARGLPVGISQPGRGFVTVIRTGSDPNPLRGRDVYKARCASCHNENGQGRKHANGSYLFPPVWGFDSYNKGAGFYRIDLLAGFIKTNMPLDKADLTDQEALDVAAWINLQERWPDPRKGLLRGLLEQ